MPASAASDSKIAISSRGTTCVLAGRDTSRAPTASRRPMNDESSASARRATISGVATMSGRDVVAAPMRVSCIAWLVIVRCPFTACLSRSSSCWATAGDASFGRRNTSSSFWSGLMRASAPLSARMMRMADRNTAARTSGSTAALLRWRATSRSSCRCRTPVLRSSSPADSTSVAIASLTTSNWTCRPKRTRSPSVRICAVMRWSLT